MLAAPIVEGQALASSPFNASGVLVRGMRGADLAKLPSIANNIRQGTLEGFDTGAGGDDRAAARRPVVAAGGRQHHPGRARRARSRRWAWCRASSPTRSRPCSRSACRNTTPVRVHAAAGSRRPISTAPATSPPSRSMSTSRTRSTRYRKLVTEAAGRPIFMVDWRQRNSTFFNALQVERNVMFLILTIIVIVAAFNIDVGPDHAGEGQGARHRHPAHHGRDPGRDHAGVHDDRRLDRLRRHARRFPAGAGRMPRTSNRSGGSCRG